MMNSNNDENVFTFFTLFYPILMLRFSGSARRSDAASGVTKTRQDEI